MRRSGHPARARALLGLALAAALALPACEPAPPPAEPGTVGRPYIVAAEVRLSESHGPSGSGRMTGIKQLEPGREAVIGTDEAVFWLQLEPTPPAGWYGENVLIAGGKTVGPRRDLFDQGMVEVRLPPGEAGDRISVTLGGVAIAGQDTTSAVYSLRRAAEPTAALEVWEGGAWRPVAPAAVIRAKPLRLRLVLSKAMDQATVNAALAAALPGQVDANWPSPHTVTFELPEPPPAIRLPTTEMRDAEGLWAHGGTPVVFTGQPPRLHSVRAGQRVSTPGATLPANVVWAGINRAGTQLLVASVAETTSLLAAGDRLRALIVPAGGGPARPLPSGKPLGWYDESAAVLVDGDRWLVAADAGEPRLAGELPADLAHLTLSPDGGKIAGLRYRHEDGDAATFLVPADLAVVHLDGGETTWFADFIWAYLPPREWEVRAGPAWAPDGGSIAGVSDRDEGLEFRLAVLGEGEAVTAGGVPGDYSSTDPFSWSPDGRAWLIGDLLVSVETGAARRLAGTPRAGRHLWAPDGGTVAFSLDWRGVVTAAADGSGGASLGPALGCGWGPGGAFFYVVWPDAAHRYGQNWP